MNQYRRNYKHENKRGDNQTCSCPSVTAVWFPSVLFNENSRTESIFTFSYIFLVLLNESSE